MKDINSVAAERRKAFEGLIERKSANVILGAKKREKEILMKIFFSARVNN